MQIVESRDIEDLMRIDLAELLPDCACFAAPAPDDLQPNSVCVTQLGGYRASPVSHEYDISIDVWAETPGKAKALAIKAQGIVAALPMRSLASGTDYKTADAHLPYNNPDPNRPLIPRCTFSATVGLRGKPLNI